MAGRKFAVLVICLLILPAALHAEDSLQTTSYMGFNPFTDEMDLNQAIIYKFPNPALYGDGPFPLFVWVPGTFETHTDIQALTFVAEMAARGFVGASVQYNDVYAFENCINYKRRARAIFDSSRSTSAISVLCHISGVNCERGAVAAGISQGAALSILASNYSPVVKAVYALSISDRNRMGIDLSSCLDKSVTDIPTAHLVIVNGQNDIFFGGQEPLQRVSGLVCPTGSTQCWHPDGNGAGWYLVQNSQVTDGNADHCYQLIGGCIPTVYDPLWFLGRYDWSLGPNLDWLASFGTQRPFAESSQ